MTCDIWDVVVVPVPFTDRATTRRRPALVVSARAFNRHGHSVLAMITSASHQAWPGDTPIRDLTAAGLKAPSLVRLKLFTIDSRCLARRIGALAGADRTAVSGTCGSACRSPPGPPEARKLPGGAPDTRTFSHEAAASRRLFSIEPRHTRHSSPRAVLIATFRTASITETSGDATTRNVSDVRDRSSLLAASQELPKNYFFRLAPRGIAGYIDAGTVLDSVLNFRRRAA